MADHPYPFERDGQAALQQARRSDVRSQRKAARAQALQETVDVRVSVEAATAAAVLLVHLASGREAWVPRKLIQDGELLEQGDEREVQLAAFKAAELRWA